MVCELERVLQVFDGFFCCMSACPWSTMECSQPAAWTTNRGLLVASRVRPFQEDRPILARPYPELRTWMVVRSGVISVFPTHSGNAPASPNIRPTTWLCPECLPSTNSIPVPIQPTIAMTTIHIHQLWLTRPPSTRSSSTSEDHPQAPVVTQQQHMMVQYCCGSVGTNKLICKCFLHWQEANEVILNVWSY